MIPAIIQFSLTELQSGEALEKDISASHCCIICGKPLKEGIQYKKVHLLTNGNIVSSEEDFEDSQGFFPVGNDCAKRLVIKFAF